MEIILNKKNVSSSGVFNF